MRVRIEVSEFIKETLKITLEEVRGLIEEDKIEFKDSIKNISTFRKLRRELGVTYDDFQVKYWRLLKI